MTYSGTGSSRYLFSSHTFVTLINLTIDIEHMIIYAYEADTFSDTLLLSSLFATAKSSQGMVVFVCFFSAFFTSPFLKFSLKLMKLAACVLIHCFNFYSH